MGHWPLHLVTGARHPRLYMMRNQAKATAGILPHLRPKTLYSQIFQPPKTGARPSSLSYPSYLLPSQFMFPHITALSRGPKGHTHLYWPKLLKKVLREKSFRKPVAYLGINPMPSPARFHSCYEVINVLIFIRLLVVKGILNLKVGKTIFFVDQTLKVCPSIKHCIPIVSCHRSKDILCQVLNVLVF